MSGLPAFMCRLGLAGTKYYLRQVATCLTGRQAPDAILNQAK